MARLGSLLIGLFLAGITLPAWAQTQQATSPSALTNLINSQFPNNTSGQITPLNLRQVTLDMAASAMLGCINAQTGVTYTVQVSDYGCLITFSNSSATTVTLPQGVYNSGLNSFFPFNTFITNKGPGTVTISPQVSTINGAATLTLNAGTGVFIVSDGTNYQTFVGNGGVGTGCVAEAGAATLGCIQLNHAYTWTNTQTFADSGTWGQGINSTNIGAVVPRTGVFTNLTGTIAAATSFVTSPQVNTINLTATTISSFTGTNITATNITATNITVSLLSSPRTASFFSNDTPPANIIRFGDELFVGDAATNNNFNSNCALRLDWFSLYEASTNLGACGYSPAFMEIVESKTNNTNASGGILSAAQSASCTSSCGTFGIATFAVNNEASNSPTAWAIYSECDEIKSLSSCYGAELETANFVSNNWAIQPDPFQQSTSVGNQIGCGAGIASPQTFRCGAAIQIVPNTNSFAAGIIFATGSILQNLGVLTQTVAIGMPAGYQIVWFNGRNAVVGTIGADASGNMFITGSALKWNTVTMVVP